MRLLRLPDFRANAVYHDRHGGGFMEHPTGEADDGSLRLDRGRRLRLEFHGIRISSGAGLLACRALDDAPGLSGLAGAALSEYRRGKNTRHLLTGLFPSIGVRPFRRPCGRERRRTSRP